MIGLMDGMPDGTLGFRVSGEVERSDYTDVMVPELRKAVEQGGGGLRTLYLVDRLEEMDPGALWEDAKAGFDLGIRHHFAWERTALVTDQDWSPAPPGCSRGWRPAGSRYSRPQSSSRRRPGCPARGCPLSLHVGLQPVGSAGARSAPAVPRPSDSNLRNFSKRHCRRPNWDLVTV